MTEEYWDIPLRAKPKARPRVTKNGTFMPKDYQKFKKDLRNLVDVYDIAIKDKLHVDFFFKAPKKLKLESVQLVPKQTKSDIDNLIGAVMDALLLQDEGIWEIKSRKFYSDSDFIRIYKI